MDEKSIEYCLPNYEIPQLSLRYRTSCNMLVEWNQSPDDGQKIYAVCSKIPTAFTQEPRWHGYGQTH